jgi:uncharacterized membrane protein SpoIIM required for sporulation
MQTYLYYKTFIYPQMVLESLITGKLAERTPWKLIPLSFAYTSTGILLSLWIFPNSDLAVIALTVMALLPLMVDLMRYEEEKEELASDLFTAHKQIIPFFIYLFLGLTISFTIWYSILPYSSLSELFKLQINTIQDVSAAAVTGSAISSHGIFLNILANNLRVLAFSILFSLIYGAGAIFIITWNSSLVGISIANTIRQSLSSAGATLGSTKVMAYFGGVSLGLAKYLTHGIPEILAYLLGGLAGGVLSVSLIKNEFGTPKFTKALIDFVILISASIITLVLAALIEVYISPAFI